MHGLVKVLSCAVLALPGSVQAAHAQTPFEQLFNPRTALSIILEMPQATWAAMAAEQPASGVCIFAWPPSSPRYPWHSTNATVITEGETRTEQLYQQIGIKKKSFCGSFHTTKPSLTLTLDRNLPANEAVAESHLGTTHLSLENSRQDSDLFRQCAGYYVFRIMGLPAPMCSFAALYRRDAASAPLVFLGLYVLTEPVKKDFFRRRADLTNVPSGSLYEFEFPDDFTQIIIANNQLQVEWSATANQDFLFAVNQVQNFPATALAKTLDLPPFIDFWATEIFLKSGDGFLSNRNNAFVFDDPPAQTPIQRTRFRFIPHGLDQILNVGAKPSVSQTSILAQMAHLDNGLRYQLIRTLASMGDQIEIADVPAHIDSFVPLVVRLWRSADILFGSDPNRAMQMAENVRRAAQQAVLDLRTVFGHGVVTPLTNTPIRLVGPHHVQCVTRVPTAVSFEVGRAACTNLPVQQWTFEPAATTMTNLGFQQSLKLYRVRNQASPRCLTVGAPFTDGSGRHKLEIATCNPQADEQRFLLVQREGRSFELRAFTENRCAHFSDSAVTNDGRPAIYLGTCDGSSKNLIVTE
ncbi:MAG: CotH kinase family protein [Rhizobiales bacterium]|nr:CotH kinase family protein [Hyphomicrobiales bacterium]